MQCAVCSTDNPDGARQCATCGVALVPADDPHVLPVGTLLCGGIYGVGRCVGHGGFGITYQGSDMKLRRSVAIKEFFPTGCARRGTTVTPSGSWTPAAFAEGRGRFLQEGEALARFDHPGIVRVYGAFEENGTACIVMEYLKGRTLERILHERGGPLPEDEALGYVRQVAEALEVMHEGDFLHRDIKPSNIMVVDGARPRPGTRVVLIDFGTAREFLRDVTCAHSVVLTPGYAPLEHYSKRARRGPYTDVYALAAVLYHLLTGTPPPEALDRHYGEALVPVRSRNPQVSERVALAIERGLEMEAGRRPQTAREFLDAWDAAGERSRSDAGHRSGNAAGGGKA